MDYREITGIRRHHNVQAPRAPESEDLKYAQTQHDIRPKGTLHLQTVRRVPLHEIQGVHQNIDKTSVDTMSSFCQRDRSCQMEKQVNLNCFEVINL